MFAACTDACKPDEIFFVASSIHAGRTCADSYWFESMTALRKHHCPLLYIIIVHIVILFIYYYYFIPRVFSAWQKVR